MPKKETLMSSSEIPIENRVIFFDNLRFFLVLCVVLQHSSNAYTNLTWWPVSDNASSAIVGWLRSFIDAFAMPLLFYIAGYFAVPTITKKGVATFLKGKLKRLGIPWGVCILVICPIVPLVYHYTRDTLILSTSYWNLWVDLMKNAAEFNVGIIYSMNELMQNNQFYRRYMWFLSLLILFFFVFGSIYSLKRSWFKAFDQPITSETPSVLSTLKTLFTVGSLTFLCSSIAVGSMLFLAPKLSNPEPFFTFGNIIQFRPSRMFLFITYFTFGVLTFSLALKYWNRLTDVNRNLASNSYNMYLAHYLFVIVFQLILFNVKGMSGLLKFGTVSVLSILCTYIVCQFILKPFSRISVVLAFSLFAIMVLVIHP